MFFVYDSDQITYFYRSKYYKNLNQKLGPSLYTLRKVLQIAAQAAHPQYNSRLIDHDYMVITTSSNWEYNDYVQPIVMVSPMNSELPNGSACQTSGYGYSQYILGQPAMSLKVHIPYAVISFFSRAIFRFLD